MPRHAFLDFLNKSVSGLDVHARQDPGSGNLDFT